METEKNIQKVSLIFFIILGTAHLLSHLMLVNGYAVNFAFAMQKIVEIPFIITAVVYGLLSLKISLRTSEKEHKLGNIVIIGILIVLFAVLMYFNLFIPDRI